MALREYDLDDMVLLVRQRADMEHSLFVTDDEIRDFIRAVWREFYGILVGEFEDAIVESSQVTVTGDTVSIGTSNPGEFLFDILKIRAVRHTNMSGEYLVPLSQRELEPLVRDGTPRGRPLGYWLHGTIDGWVLEFAPIPEQSYELQVRYVPLLEIDDFIDAETRLGFNWSDYCVIGAAIMCKDKEESDCSVLLMQKGALLDNMRKNWTPVDTAEAQRVVQLMKRSTRVRHMGLSSDPDDEESLLG